MKSNIYLYFNGQCEAAFKFYEQCLGGKITSMMTYGDSPMAEQASSELRTQIMNPTFRTSNLAQKVIYEDSSFQRSPQA